MPELVDIRLASFVYRFRRLTWLEEAQIKIPPGTDPRDTLLAHALHDVSGLLIPSLDERKQVVRKIPPALRWRIWVVYRGNLPSDRYFITKGLYQAPEYQAHNKRLIEDGQAETPDEDSFHRHAAAQEEHEARAMENRIFAQALEKQRRLTAKSG